MTYSLPSLVRIVNGTKGVLCNNSRIRGTMAKKYAGYRFKSSLRIFLMSGLGIAEERSFCQTEIRQWRQLGRSDLPFQFRVLFSICVTGRWLVHHSLSACLLARLC